MRGSNKRDNVSTLDALAEEKMFFLSFSITPLCWCPIQSDLFENTQHLFLFDKMTSKQPLYHISLSLLVVLDERWTLMPPAFGTLVEFFRFGLDERENLLLFSGLDIIFVGNV